MENKLTTSLIGLNAVVCGGTSGIGLATAHEFAACGANVTIFSRNENKLKKVVLSLQNSDKQKHQYLVGDFNIPDTIQKIMKSHIEKLLEVDPYSLSQKEKMKFFITQ